jgi:hypothetical protein
MTIEEMQDFKITLACIYKSPDRDCYEFLKKFELVICKVKSKGKQYYLVNEYQFLARQCKTPRTEKFIFLV